MINCIIVDKNKAERKIVEGVLRQIRHLHIVKTCASLADAAEYFLSHSIHILFIDLEHPTIESLNILDEMKQERPKIIIMSAEREMATFAYDIDAIDFILKPISVARVVKAMAKALHLDHSHKELIQDDSSIFLKIDHKFVKVDLKDIYLVEALSDYVNVHTNNKRYTVHGTMKAMEERLPESDFIRVHKSYIVRIDHIVEVERETLFIEKRMIPVGNTFRKPLMERLKII
jgi:two-component system response regulator LytT